MEHNVILQQFNFFLLRYVNVEIRGASQMLEEFEPIILLPRNYALFISALSAVNFNTTKPEQTPFVEGGALTSWNFRDDF